MSTYTTIRPLQVGEKLVDDKGRVLPPFQMLWQQLIANPAFALETGQSAQSSADAAQATADGKQTADADLTAISALTGTGIAARTADDTWALRTLTAPAAGISITNPAGIAGNPTFALSNDLAALEALSGTNTIYYRSAADTWSAVTIGTGLTFSAGTLSASGGGGGSLSDGDYGDITVGGSGTTLTIDNNAVTFAKFVAAGSAGFVGATASGNYSHRTPAQVTAALDAVVGDSGSGGTKGLVPAPASGDAAAGKFLKADGTWAAPSSGGSFRGALVKKSSDQTGVNATSTFTIGWDSEDYDTDSIHDNSTNNSRLTVPSGVTRVRLTGALRLNNVTSNTTVSMAIFKNGSATYTGFAAQFAQSGLTNPALNVTTSVLQASSGDYFEMTMFSQSDTSIDIVASQSSFGMELIA